MGLVIMDDNILVSYGYEDYYNCIIEFNKKNLIDNIVTSYKVCLIIKNIVNM